MLNKLRQKTENSSRNRTTNIKRQLQMRSAQNFMKLENLLKERQLKLSLRKSAPSQKPILGHKNVRHSIGGKNNLNKDVIPNTQYYSPPIQKNPVFTKKPKKNNNSAQKLIQPSKKIQKQQQNRINMKKLQELQKSRMQFSSILGELKQDDEYNFCQNHGQSNSVKTLKLSEIKKTSQSNPVLQQYFISEEALKKIHKYDLKYQIGKSKEKLIISRMKKHQ